MLSQLDSKSTNGCEPTEEKLECHSVVWWVLSHESLIKSYHVEARQDPGLQCKLWPEPNAWLSRPGQDGGGILFLPGVTRGGVSKLLQLKCPWFPLSNS